MPRRMTKGKDWAACHQQTYVQKRVLEDSGKSGTICQMKASSFLVPRQGYALSFRLRRDFMKTIKHDIMKSGKNVLRSFRDFFDRIF